MKKSYHGLPLKDALLIKSAQFWLLLGEPAEAVTSLQQLTRRAWENPWARAVFRCAARQFGSDADLDRLERKIAKNDERIPLSISLIRSRVG